MTPHRFLWRRSSLVSADQTGSFPTCTSERPNRPWHPCARERSSVGWSVNTASSSCLPGISAAQSGCPRSSLASVEAGRGGGAPDPRATGAQPSYGDAGLRSERSPGGRGHRDPTASGALTRPTVYCKEPAARITPSVTRPVAGLCYVVAPEPIVARDVSESEPWFRPYRFPLECAVPHLR